MDNGNAWALNGGKVDAPSKREFPQNLQQDSEVAFIDIDTVQNEMISVNQKLREYSDVGATANFTDINNQYIEIMNPGSMNSYNLQPDAISQNSTIAVKGFEKGRIGTLVINVELAGRTSFTFPGSAICYTDGSQAPNSEVEIWQDGNILWNFFDSSDSQGVYRGSVNNSRATAGHILAPGATVDLTQNLNGTVIADNIIVSAESHRTDFTGVITETKNPPVDPTNPVEPKDPVDPTGPVDPTNSVEPKNPVDPTGPVAPTKPEETTGKTPMDTMVNVPVKTSIKKMTVGTKATSPKTGDTADGMWLLYVVAGMSFVAVGTLLGKCGTKIKFL